MSAVATICRRHHLDVCYLFGSLARDRMNPTSDIDIAILGSDITMTRHDAVHADLAELCTPHRIDLVNLADASVVLCMNVVTHGVVLFRRTADALTQFRYQTISHYLATARLRTLQHQQLEREFL